VNPRRANTTPHGHFGRYSRRAKKRINIAGAGARHDETRTKIVSDLSARLETVPVSTSGMEKIKLKNDNRKNVLKSVARAIIRRGRKAGRTAVRARRTTKQCIVVTCLLVPAEKSFHVFWMKRSERISDRLPDRHVIIFHKTRTRRLDDDGIKKNTR